MEVCSTFHGDHGNPKEISDRPPPLPEPAEFHATKKVRHIEEDSTTVQDYRSRLLAGSEIPVTLEELCKGSTTHVNSGDVVVDRTQPIPAISLSTELKERLASNMKFSIVVSLLGRPIGYTMLCAKLRQLWDLRGAKIVDMGGGFFLVQFASDEAYQEEILQGPWTLLGSYLQVQSWTTAFRIQQAAPCSMTVWIRISGLPLHFYPTEVISAIGEVVGKVVRVDSNTSGMQRGKFARLAVTVDLTKPLTSKFTLDGEEFKVEYENMENLCFLCGMYGHTSDGCTHRPKGQEGDAQGDDGSTSMEVVSPDIYRPWMVVEKKRKQQGRARGEDGGRGGFVTPTGSRFDVIREEGDDGRRGDEGSMTQDSATPTAAKVEISEGVKRGYRRGRNSRPAKATFGELFEFTSKARKKERIVPSRSTSDVHSNSTV